MKRKILIIISVIVFAFILKLFVCERAAHTMPEIDRTDISELLLKENLSDEEYKVLLQQTGLGKSAVLDIKSTSNTFKEDILKYQEQNFEKSDYKCEYLFPVSNEEVLVTPDGERKTIMIPPVKDGDILITKATHTLGFRHGHSAIVIDAKNEITLESVVLGTKSAMQELDKWIKYPSLLILRHKNNEASQNAVQFAKEKLIDVDYGIFVGLLKKDKQHMNKIDSTQCAHLVWQAYYAAGEDIDKSGWLVIPDNIAQNNSLEIVFSYGFNPITRR